MRALLAKDLRILGRSRLLIGVLVIYPVAIALLIGFAISRSPARARVAIVDETPVGETVQVGSRRVGVGAYAQELFSQVDSVRASTRAEAEQKVLSGEVVAAVVIPHDIAALVSSGTHRGTVEVLYNGDALEQSIVQSTIESAISQANLAFSEQIQRTAAQAIDDLLEGGRQSVLGTGNLVGLKEIPAAVRAAIARLPPGRERSELERVEQFANFAASNLSASKQVLSTIGQPIQVQSTLLHGRRTPLNTFAVVVAVAVSLMFVCVLLAAGGLALEREENTLARLIRGLVSRGRLLSEKILLAAVCAFVVSLAMLAGVGAFVTLDWSRFGMWALALAFGALSFGALGVAIGALAREVRAASLLAFLLSLPLAFLALVPHGAVSSGVWAAISAISFVFPFKACLQALDTAVNGASPGLGASLLHLAVLTAAFAALARVGLRSAD